MQDSIDNALNFLRSRQHEFENHLLVFSSLPYASESFEELSARIRAYAAKLGHNVISETFGLLKLEPPAFAAFLIGKLNGIKQAGIDVTVHIDGFFTDEISVEDFELVEIMGTLLDNAIESLDGKNAPRIEVTLGHTFETRRRLYLSVKNSNSQIDADILDKLFLPGFSPKADDRGFGLFNVKRIVDKYGRISINNTQDGCVVAEVII